jgi:hypothetical protein
MQPQEIFKPVVERVRTFTIPQEKPKSKERLWYEAIAAHIRACTTEELLQYIILS